MNPIHKSIFFKNYRKENIFWRWKKAKTTIIMGWFYPTWNLTSILWLYTCVLNLNSIHLCFQKISNWNYFSTLKKGSNSKYNWWILPGTLNQTWPLFYNYMLVYKIWIQFTNLFESYGMETIFQSWKRAITPKIIGGFYPKSNLTYILWLYTCV